MTTFQADLGQPASFLILRDDVSNIFVLPHVLPGINHGNHSSNPFLIY